MYRIQKQVTTEALMMLKRDRRREIDAVIDYFGEWRGSICGSTPSGSGDVQRVHRLESSVPLGDRQRGTRIP